MRRLGLVSTAAVVLMACLQAQASRFDSARAFEDLKQMVAIGPRPAGSPQLRQTRAYITREISKLGLRVEEQPFTAETPVGKVDMVNLIVKLPGKRTDRILFTGHYDTKPIKDFVFVGASDGASSAAGLLELVRALKDQPHEFTYEFIWLDGEEAFCKNWTDCGTPDSPDHTYGSRFYVEAAKKANAIGTMKANILLDMIGDKDLEIRKDSLSTKWLSDLVYAAAKRAGHGRYFPDIETTVEDDHVPFLAAGIPSVDIIDLDYPHWHTETDTLENVSARSLQIVGDVILAALKDLEKRLIQK